VSSNSKKYSYANKLYGGGSKKISKGKNYNNSGLKTDINRRSSSMN